VEQFDYDDFIHVVLEGTGGNFMLVHLSHSRALKGDGSATNVLAFILNQLRMKDSNPSDRKYLVKKQGWFPCPAKRIQRDLGMTKHRQIRAINTLIKKELIETSNRGGNQLWVRIKADKLKKIQTNSEKNRSPESGSPESGSPESGTLKSGKRNSEVRKAELPLTNKPSKEKTNPAAKRGDDCETPSIPLAKERNRIPDVDEKEGTRAAIKHKEKGSNASPFLKASPAKELADLFHAQGTKAGKISFPRNHKTLKAWERDFVEGLRNAPFAKIKLAVETHFEHAGEDYWPSICSPRELFEKWDKLVTQAKRRGIDLTLPKATEPNRPAKDTPLKPTQGTKVLVRIGKGTLSTSKLIEVSRLVPVRESPDAPTCRCLNALREETTFAILPREER
jgi:hypothetical protein